MKYVQWHTNGESFIVKINGINDVFDLHRFKYDNDFNSFKELVGGTRERESAQVAKNVFNDFLKLLAQDLIVNNEIFLMPFAQFGYIKMSNMADSRREDYVYDIQSEGKIWCPHIKLDKHVRVQNIIV